MHDTVSHVTMIYFQTKPDAVFEAMLKEAFASEASEIQLLSDDGAIDSWEGLYPETSQCLSPYTVVRVLMQLLAAMHDSQIYQLTNLHWLVLYESLKNFCATHNDLLDEFDQLTRPLGEYRVGGIDAEALVEMYFWDTDFLLHRERDSWGEEYEDDSCQRDEMERTMWEQEDLIPSLQPTSESGWIVPAPGQYFRPGSTRYPDDGET